MQQNKKTKHHIRYFRVGCALVTLGLLIGGAVFLMNRNSEKTAKSDDSSSADSQVNTSDVSVIYDSEPDEIGELDELKTQIENKITEYPGEWSVYIKNLNIYVKNLNICIKNLNIYIL